MTLTVKYGLAALASITLIVLSLTQKIPYAWTDAVTFVTGAWYVWLISRQNMWAWAVGAANAVFTGVVMWRLQLPLDTGLQGMYFLFMIAGAFLWSRKTEGATEVPIRTLSVTGWMAALAVGALGVMALLPIGKKLGSALPTLDASLTSFSLVAQFLTSYKYIENWLFWIGLNLVYIPLLWVRDARLVSVLYFVYLVLAVVGYLDWKKSTPRG